MPSLGSRGTDARRVALDARLQRLKRVAVAAALSSGLVLWGLVAQSVATAGAATPQPPTTPVSEDDRLRADFFGNGSFLGTGNGVAPLIRTHGS